ncbi:MAG TPA: ABC transporter permease [Limnochordia bacterium]|jgi:ribose transport system permease protein|nr:ABC transporter permease [Limnochordia bacterium]
MLVQKSELSGESRFSRKLFFQKYAAIVMLAVVVLVFSIASPYFLTTTNLMNIAIQTSVIGVLTIAQLIVLLTAGIDLSVGAVTAIAGVLAAMMMRSVPVFVATIGALIIGAVFGYANGLIISKMKVPPFIVTLGMSGMLRGLNLVITNGLPISNLPTSVAWFGRGKVLGIPVPVFFLIVVTLLFQWILSKTRLGRYTYAIGSNEEATRLSGINTAKYVRIIYMLAGLLSGLAGMILIGRLNSAHPTAAQGYEVNAIAASVIGGASLMGGVGTAYGAIVGAFIMTILNNGLTLLGVSAFYQQIAVGAILIVAVCWDYVQRRA